MFARTRRCQANHSLGAVDATLAEVAEGDFDMHGAYTCEAWCRGDPINAAHGKQDRC